MTGKVHRIHDDVSVRQIGDAIIRKAVRADSSDIQIIPREGFSLIRFRVDGEFSAPVKIPGDLHQQVLNYFKQLVAESYGAAANFSQVFRIHMAQHSYDISVETHPTRYGESIMVHISPADTMIVDLSSTGMQRALREKVEKALSASSGVVLLSGPQGSGKTHTMYAFLKYLAAQGKKVVTVEKKVELSLSGVVQIEHPKQEGEIYLDDVLMQRLRHMDADVVMVDGASHEQHIQRLFQLAKSGCMVLSSVRANDTISTLSYLMSLNLDKELLASELNMIISQRLLKRLCPQCAEQVVPDVEVLARLNLDSDTRVFKAVGCAACMQTGYAGHLPVHEVMSMSDDMAHMIQAQSSDEALLHVCHTEGMSSLFEDAVDKALRGQLNMSDIVRELPKPSQWEKQPLPELQHQQSHTTSFSFHQRSEEALKRMQTASSAQNPSLLLIEDSATMRDYISYILRRGGSYDVVDVETAEEGLSIILQEKPSVIVTDQVLPGMNGTSFIATVRSNPKLADIPIVLLTSESKMEIEALRTGADGYIEKPVDPDLLLARVNAVFSAYKRMRQQ